MTDASDDAIQHIPPSQLRRYTFSSGEVETIARYAKWVSGDPDRLFTFSASEVTAHDVEINPPSTFETDSPYATMKAFYVGDEENVIVYFLENMDDEAVIDFAACYAILELHELTHWAIPEEDNEQDPDHWEPWNRVLTEAVGHVMDIDEWDIQHYQPPEVDKAADRTDPSEQATLREVIDVAE